MNQIKCHPIAKKNLEFYLIIIFFNIFITFGSAMIINSYGLASERKSLNIGYSRAMFSDVDIHDAQFAMEMYSEELCKTLQLPSKPKSFILANITEIVKSIKEKEIDVITLPALDYLKIKDHVNLKPALVGVSSGTVEEEYVLLVNRDEGVNDLEQLRNTRISIQTSYGIRAVAFLWLDTLLRKRGFPRAEGFFREVKHVEKASQAILPVFFKQMEVAIVPLPAYLTMTKLNPQIGQNVAVFATSPPLVRGINFFRTDLPEALQEKILGGAEVLHTYARGKQILTLFKCEKVVRFQPTNLDNLITLLQQSQFR